MPVRKKNARQPEQYAFVMAELGNKGVNWRSLHSGSTRSHAAYWGGKGTSNTTGGPQTSHGLQMLGAASSNTSLSTSDPEYALEVLETSRVRSRKRKLGGMMAAVGGCPSVPRCIESNDADVLPTSSENIGGSNKSIACMFKFFGRHFVRQGLGNGHDDYSLLHYGCCLLSEAHSMALTGQGSKTKLLQLKSQVIADLSSRMNSLQTSVSPQVLVAVLVLGAPIVCMTSQDLPMGLEISEYINFSAQEDWLCCTASANTAQRALEERIVHRQALKRLLSRSEAVDLEDGSATLRRYVSNSIDISMAIESAEYLRVPFDYVPLLFPDIEDCYDCSVPAVWQSPLTCRFKSSGSASEYDASMMLLAEVVHKWLATFLDESCQIVIETSALLAERQRLRTHIEQFSPAVESCVGEAESRYECCRWAALMLLDVERQHSPIYMAAKRIKIRPRLVKRLRVSDLGNRWGVRKGLLFWVASICHFSTASQCFPLLTTTLLAQFQSEMAMLDSFAEIAIKPLKRLKVFESLCCYQGIVSVSPSISPFVSIPAHFELDAAATPIESTY